MATRLARSCLLATIALATLLVAVVPGAAVTSPVALAAACPEPIGADEFADVLATQPHSLAIRCLRAWEVTSGVGGGRYDPDGTVNRAQMATFLRALLGTTQAPATGEQPVTFTDVDGISHREAIDDLASLGLVQGTSATTYSPARDVTRGQMATFVMRLLDHAGVVTPTNITAFADTADHAHEVGIGQLAALGVVTGVRPDEYVPDAPVTRAQMASFLMRAADVLVQKGHATVPYAEEGELPAAPEPFDPLPLAESPCTVAPQLAAIFELDIDLNSTDDVEESLHDDQQSKICSLRRPDANEPWPPWVLVTTDAWRNPDGGVTLTPEGVASLYTYEVLWEGQTVGYDAMVWHYPDSERGASGIYVQLANTSLEIDTSSFPENLTLAQRQDKLIEAAEIAIPLLWPAA